MLVMGALRITDIAVRMGSRPSSNMGHGKEKAAAAGLLSTDTMATTPSHALAAEPGIRQRSAADIPRRRELPFFS